jgi:hypothetical protein
VILFSLLGEEAWSGEEAESYSQTGHPTPGPAPPSETREGVTVQLFSSFFLFVLKKGSQNKAGRKVVFSLPSLSFKTPPKLFFNFNFCLQKVTSSIVSDVKNQIQNSGFSFPGLSLTVTR